MFLEPNAAPQSKLVPTKYRVTNPGYMRLRHPGLGEKLMGFGIGEIIVTLEPDVQLLIPRRLNKESIQLVGGFEAFWWDDDIAVVLDNQPT